MYGLKYVFGFYWQIKRKEIGSLTIFALFPSDDEVIRRERPSRRMASPSDETNKVSFAKIVKEPRNKMNGPSFFVNSVC